MESNDNIGGFSQPEPDRRGFKSEAAVFIWETVKVLIISLAIILPIRYYLVQPFFVKGASMEPTFEDGDYLLIDELSYRFREPERGEVIIFHFPQEKDQFFIKRIIGLPEEKVVINNQKITIYNEDNPKGLVLDEDYLADFQVTTGQVNIELENGQFYVLGDNRLQSLDSRRWGPVPKELIVGRVMVRAWPFNRFTAFGEVQYN